VEDIESEGERNILRALRKKSEAEGKNQIFENNSLRKQRMIFEENERMRQANLIRTPKESDQPANEV
jgi:hypothetical protein